MELSTELTERISKTIDASYNMGVDHAISVVEGVKNDVADVPVTFRDGIIKLLDATITRLINLKK